jgi:adhesin/invasin
MAAALGAAAGCGDGGPAAGDQCGAEPGQICTLIGNGEAGLGEDGMDPLDVSLYLPQDLTIGPDGLPYVLDWNNHRVRTLVDGKVQTIIGTGELGDAPDGPALQASLNHPTHLLFDARGGILLSAWHNSKVMRYDPDSGELTTMCGDGRREYGGDGGPADKAVLDLPVATAFDDQERLLIMDQANQRIRRIENDGSIATVVGPSDLFVPAPENFTAVCGEPSAPGLNPCKLCKADEAIADPIKCAARKAQGYAGEGAPGSEALMYQPFSQSAPPAGRMEKGPDGSIFFCDTGNHLVRALRTDGTVETVAGTPPAAFDLDNPGGYAGDDGPATEALLQRPTDVAIASDGTLYIADTFNSCIRKVDPEGVITTAAGVCGERGYRGDGGPATEALLTRPYGVALDADDNLYIADTHNHRIRVVYAP